MNARNHLREKGRCVSCAFFCRIDQYKPVEIMDSGRRAILDGTYARSLCPQLRCYKNLRADIFDNNTEGNAQDTMKNVYEAASCKEWQLHRDGFSPNVAEQRQVASKHYRWIKIAAVAYIISIAVIVILRFATCPQTPP